MLSILAISSPYILTLLALVLCCTLVSIAIAYYLKRFSSLLRTEAIVAMLAPWLLVATFGIWSLRIYSSYEMWDAARLSPVVALVRGISVYTSATEGVALPTAYPPGSYLAYLPTTLATTPCFAILIGRILACLYFFGPVLCLLAAVGRRFDTKLLTFLLVACGFVAYALSSACLSYSGLNIHADAPALGFACCAIGFAMGRCPRISTREVVASAICATLSVSCKQTLVFVPLVIACWLLVVQGWRQSLLFALTGAITALGLLFAYSKLLGIDLSNLWFNTITVLSRHGWTAHGFGLIAPLLDVLTVTLPLLGVYGFLVFSKLRSHSMGFSVQDWRERYPSLLVLCCGLTGAPFALFGVTKIGADVNSLSLSVYFLTIAVAIELLTGIASQTPRTHRISFWGTCLLLVVLLPFNLQTAFDLFRSSYAMSPEGKNNLAFAYLQKYPGRAYFPDLPLAHLLAEGPPRHHSYAVYDRALGGFPLSLQHFQQFGPHDAEFVCFSQPDGSETFPGHLLDEYSVKREIPELARWHCYERPSSSRIEKVD